MSANVYAYEWRAPDAGDEWIPDMLAVPASRDPASYLAGYIDGAVEFRGDEVEFRNWRHEQDMQVFKVRWTHRIGGEEHVTIQSEFGRDRADVEAQIAKRSGMSTDIIEPCSGEII